MAVKNASVVTFGSDCHIVIFWTLIAKDDELGRKLQDLGLLTRKRAPKKSGDY